MATLTKRLRGGSLMFEVQWYEGGRRRTIPLGKKYTERTARGLQEVVDTLLHCQANGIETPGKRTLAWIESASPEIREKLANAGLIEIPPSHTLKELWDAFLAQKTKELKVGTIKESTYSLYDFIRKRFFLFFDKDELLDDLAKDRMQRWKDHLLDEVAEATVACYIKETKSCFNWAVSNGWIDKSPLDGIGTGSFVNKKNTRIVSMSDYRRFLDACPCQDWRVIIALSRIGGLRCPNEVLALRWEDVHWSLNRFFVRSPKTERHAGKEGRWVPIFPELREELEALFFSPESEGREFVVNRYRDTSQNLRTTFGKIVHRAGLEMFPQPFRNLRMTRSNEVYNRWGAFKESQWIGHSSRVRADHYLMITDDDFWEAAERTELAGHSETVASSRKKSAFPGFPAILPAVPQEKSLQGVESVERANKR